jgi:hypothetical protein
MVDFIIPGIGVTIVSAFKKYLSAKQERKEVLAENLRKIALLLTSIRESLQKGIVPRELSYELAAVINFVNESLGGVFFPEPSLQRLFETTLPHVGYLIREADIFIDGEPRQHVHAYMLKARDTEFTFSKDHPPVAKASREIERAIGELKGIAFVLDKSAKATKVVASKPKTRRAKKSLHQNQKAKSKK